MNQLKLKVLFSFASIIQEQQELAYSFAIIFSVVIVQFEFLKIINLEFHDNLDSFKIAK